MLSFFFQSHWTYIVFYSVTVLWLLEFIVFPNKHKSSTYQEKKSFFYILSLILLTVILNFIFGFYGWLIVKPSWLSYVAISLYTFGLILRVASIIYLGKFFTRHVEVQEKHALVSKGPYLLLRHPLYLGLFLLTVNVPLFFGNIVISGLSMLWMGYILNQRMHIEEQALEMSLGKSYTVWKEKRYRFIPFIY
ncbi:MAG: methyltransferase family protein [Acholeplasmataceae bacterium]